jgi:hypothetical protein
MAKPPPSDWLQLLDILLFEIVTPGHKQHVIPLEL